MTMRRLQHPSRPNPEVIHLLFWYAVRQERGGDTGLFDAILNLTEWITAQLSSFHELWHLSASKMCTYGSLRAAVLAGPNIYWEQGQSMDNQGLISKWAAGISVSPHTEEVAGRVVDTLFRIAAIPHLLPFIPADAWSWLKDRPSQPPAHRDLFWRCNRNIVRTVRELGDIGILTSYLIIIWSWRVFINLSGFAEVRMSICEDLKGINMGYHRAELIQLLDSISINQPSVRSGAALANYIRITGAMYQEFKRMLQEVDRNANEILIKRMPSSFIFPTMLTLMGLHRTLLHLHVCPASPVSVTSHSERLTPFEINRFVYSRCVPLLFPCALPVDLERSQFYLNIYHSECVSRKIRYSFSLQCPRIFLSQCLHFVSSSRLPISISMDYVSVEHHTAEHRILVSVNAALSSVISLPS